MSIRDEIRELCIAHDRFMAEQANEPIRRPPVSETELPRIIYRDYDGAAFQPTPEPTPEPTPDALFGDWRDDALARGIGFALSEVRHQLRTEREAALVTRDRKIAELEGELREIRGMLGATLALLGQKSEGSSSVRATNPRTEVVELPRGFMRRVQNG